MNKVAAAVVVACSHAAGGTVDDAFPDSTYLRYADGFASYTARLEAKDCNGKPHHATATLISDRWAITAAHVVDGCEGVVVSGKFIDKIVIHPDWRDRFGESDIALLHASEPFGRDFYPPLATRRHSPGSVVSIAGYGVTGPLSAGHSISDGRLRAGTNSIERYERHILICRLRRRSSPLEFGIAPGDSGGPVFCGGELVGVSSMTMADRGPLRSRDGEESGHTDVFEFREWIQEVIK
jgi:hypothetical protein